MQKKVEKNRDKAEKNCKLCAYNLRGKTAANCWKARRKIFLLKFLNKGIASSGRAAEKIELRHSP